jgi:putative 4-mercaptohistidine N1-methyltranferase
MKDLPGEAGFAKPGFCAYLQTMNPYETDSLLREYLLLHFGNAEETFGGLPGPAEALNFPCRCVTELLDVSLVPSNARALDVGCAVGASCFELARTCSQVLGIDYSRGFIEAAKKLGERGSLDSAILVEAGRMLPFTARVPEGIDRARVSFETGDATALKPELKDFDVVLAANLICRLPKPMDFLNRVPELVKPGGQLLLTTPFTWLEDYTPQERWLGKQRPAIEDLTEILEPHFELAHSKDLPFVIREHARKFQYGFPLGTRWIRRK